MLNILRMSLDITKTKNWSNMKHSKSKIQLYLNNLQLIIKENLQQKINQQRKDKNNLNLMMNSKARRR